MLVVTSSLASFIIHSLSLFVYLCLCLFVYVSVGLHFVRPTVCQAIHQHIHPFIRSSIYGQALKQMNACINPGIPTRVARWLSPNYGTLAYWAIYTCIVRYYYQYYTGQRAEIPDSPVKYRTPGNPNTYAHKPIYNYT